ncbi:MAG: HAMP domain-containing protein [Cyanobacteria bacterium]|jgi:twitching motility protein PilJ|nr:HAMP domain-containing protein [Cyanobacteria bacterium GSL.Bin1]
MASRTHKNQQEYERAKTAYITDNYEEAAEIIEKLVQESPNDPEFLLLRGHIYCYFQNLEGAKEQYNLVIQNTDNEDYIECANSGLETVEQWEREGVENFSAASTQAPATTNTSQWSTTSTTHIVQSGSDGEDITEIWSEEENSEFEDDEDEYTGDLSQDLADPFDEAPANATTEGEPVNPFTELSEDEVTAISALNDDFDEEDEEVTNLEASDMTNSFHSQDSQNLENQAPTRFNHSTGSTSGNDDSQNQGTLLSHTQNAASASFSEGDSTDASLIEEEFDFDQYTDDEDFLEDGEDDDLHTFGYIQPQPTEQSANLSEGHTKSSGQGGSSGAFSQNQESPQGHDHETVTSQETLDAFSEEESAILTDENHTGGGQGLFASSPEQRQGAELFNTAETREVGADRSLDGSSQDDEPVVEQEQGSLAFLENASLAKKQKIFSGAVGIASAVVVAVGSFALSTVGENKPTFLGNLVKSSAVGLVGGAASGAVTWVMGGVVVKQIKRSTSDLQAQLYAVQQGNLDAKATVYSQDEFGQLASGFNQMTRVVSTTMNEAQRKAQEQEQAKEDLQRQVIRLLDDVEGAARGDLTVQAQVSADVLGAVADAFNLTIRSLRTIVQQVKEAARQVNEGAAESASFAGGLSEDALRQAEELAVSLNSAQMMTESIQRVADNAKEAESVARTASETALKGGEAVDSTVAGILQIRETVAQSTRKVKRLAESSQEISKIVSVISQIATRTNNLALNASIEAARAGEAGRGFAVIADEVRQLADRSTKSLREIEKIVLQIQSETSSVMIAMEEGTQQVIEGTERAEQAKNALEDIIQVSNRIDSLVQSITADTVEQSETAQSVAQVMQSVEMTAQGTSQESQQVSTALQNLVSLAGDLLASVERFRVNPEDK